MTSEHYKNEVIKEKREAAGLTQEQLAALVNTHWVTISRVESGKVCSFQLLCQIATALNMSWRELMRLDPIPPVNNSSPAITFAVDCV